MSGVSLGRRWLTTSIIAIGLASLLSDACYELIIPLLPAFVTALGGGALAVGLIEGVADAAAAGAKLWGGSLADRTPRRRAWTAAGYVGVGIFMPAIAFAASVPAVLAARAAAWVFRGFRSPIRDTLLVDNTEPKFVNRAFGFQRALDTVGAVIGPAAAMLMVAVHVPLRTVIAFGFIPGLLAGVMYVFVRERARTPAPSRPLHLVLSELPVAFKQYVVGAGIFGIGNFSATLLVLVAIRALTPAVGSTAAVVYATGMYLAHNVIYASLAYPAGVISERLGSGRMLAIGFGIFVATCAVVALGSTSVPAVAAAFVLAATSIAIVDPMEGAFATSLLPAERRGTGFGLLAAINGVGDLVSSAGVGALWQFANARLAFAAAGVACLIGIFLVLPVAARRA